MHKKQWVYGKVEYELLTKWRIRNLCETKRPLFGKSNLSSEKRKRDRSINLEGARLEMQSPHPTILLSDEKERKKISSHTLE